MASRILAAPCLYPANSTSAATESNGAVSVASLRADLLNTRGPDICRMVEKVVTIDCLECESEPGALAENWTCGLEPEQARRSS